MDSVTEKGGRLFQESDGVGHPGLFLTLATTRTMRTRLARRICGTWHKRDTK